MGWQAFIASLVKSLAWPLAVTFIVVILRVPLSHAITVIAERVRHLKVWGAEADLAEKWDKQTKEVTDLIATPKTATPDAAAHDATVVTGSAQLEGGGTFTATGVKSGPLDDVWPLIVDSPVLAVVRGHEALTRRLDSFETLREPEAVALTDLTELRDQALMIPEDKFTPEMAAQYLSTVSTVLHNAQPG